MNCREFVDFLMAYLDGELPSEQRTVFEGHIHECPPCGVYLDQYRETAELGKKVCCEEDDATVEAPEELIQAILAARRA